jgi:hypothetical protein
MMEIIIAAAGLALVILSSAVGVVFKLSRIELSIRADHGREISDLRSAYGKDIAELQAKVYKMEIWARDEFVRKASFESVVARLEKSMEMLGTKIETAVDKMAARVENMVHPHQP